MAPGKIPGCSGTRNLSDNLSDLRAQIAANRKVLKSPSKPHIPYIHNAVLRRE